MTKLRVLEELLDPPSAIEVISTLYKHFQRKFPKSASPGQTSKSAEGQYPKPTTTSKNNSNYPEPYPSTSRKKGIAIDVDDLLHSIRDRVDDEEDDEHDGPLRQEYEIVNFSKFWDKPRQLEAFCYCYNCPKPTYEVVSHDTFKVPDIKVKVVCCVGSKIYVGEGLAENGKAARTKAICSAAKNALLDLSQGKSEVKVPKYNLGENSDHYRNVSDDAFNENIEIQNQRSRHSFKHTKDFSDTSMDVDRLKVDLSVFKNIPKELVKFCTHFGHPEPVYDIIDENSVTDRVTGKNKLKVNVQCTFADKIYLAEGIDENRNKATIRARCFAAKKGILDVAGNIPEVIIHDPYPDDNLDTEPVPKRPSRGLNSEDLRIDMNQKWALQKMLANFCRNFDFPQPKYIELSNASMATQQGTRKKVTVSCSIGDRDFPGEAIGDVFDNKVAANARNEAAKLALLVMTKKFPEIVLIPEETENPSYINQNETARRMPAIGSFPNPVPTSGSVQKYMRKVAPSEDLRIDLNDASTLQKELVNFCKKFNFPQPKFDEMSNVTASSREHGEHRKVSVLCSVYLPSIPFQR